MIAHTIRRLEKREAELKELITRLRGSDRREMNKILRETRQLRAIYTAQLQRNEAES